MEYDTLCTNNNSAARLHALSHNGYENEHCRVVITAPDVEFITEALYSIRLSFVVIS